MIKQPLPSTGLHRSGCRRRTAVLVWLGLRVVAGTACLVGLVALSPGALVGGRLRAWSAGWSVAATCHPLPERVGARTDHRRASREIHGRPECQTLHPQLP